MSKKKDVKEKRCQRNEIDKGDEEWIKKDTLQSDRYYYAFSP